MNDKKSCYQLIKTISISEKKKLGQKSSVKTMAKAKNLEFPSFFFQGLWLLLWLLWSILWLVNLAEWTSYEPVRSQVSDYSQLSD